MEELIAELNKSQNKVDFLLAKTGEGKINASSFVAIVGDHLSDEQRAEAIRRAPELDEQLRNYFVKQLFTKIDNQELKLDLIKNCDEIKRISRYDIANEIKTFGASIIYELFQDENTVRKYQYNNTDLKDIISVLSNEEKLDLLSNSELLESLKCGKFRVEQDENGRYKNVFEKFSTLKDEKYTLAAILAELDCSDDKRLELALKNEIKGFDLKNICSKLSEERIINIISNGLEGLDDSDRRLLMNEISADGLYRLFNKDFYKLYDIYGDYFYNAIGSLDVDKLEHLFSNIDNLNVSESVKRKLVGGLSKSNSEKINETVLPKRLQEIAKLERSDDIATYGIVFNKDIDVSIYQDLDQYIVVNPIDFNDEGRKALLKLIKVCPNVRIRDNLDISASTPKEYISGELWVQDVLRGIKPNWNDIQKIAYIDNRIGSKISYSPEFNLDGFDAAGARALWKIIDSGYGVCNGIAQVEKYLFDKVGISSEMIGTGGHAFLKIKNIDIPTNDGVKRGNTILDPTWNLALQKFGARPNDFLLSYEDIRKHDMLKNGVDRGSHRNDEKLSDCTLSISDEAMRDAYRSIGLTLNGTLQFPIGTLINEIQEEDKSLSLEQRIDRRLELLREYRPDFAEFIDSTQFILSRVVIPEKELEYDKAIIDKVHRKDDKMKNAALYSYIKEGDKEYFYVVEKGSLGFTKLSREEFEQTYKMFDKDLAQTQGKNRWDIEEKKEIDLNSISGRGDIEAEKQFDKGDKE